MGYPLASAAAALAVAVISTVSGTPRATSQLPPTQRTWSIASQSPAVSGFIPPVEQHVAQPPIEAARSAVTDVLGHGVVAQLLFRVS